MFKREEIIVRNLQILFESKKAKISSFQGLNEVNLFLVTTCWIYNLHKLKLFRCVPKTGILTKLYYKLCRTDNHGKEMFHRYKRSFCSKFLIINTETKYWKILHIKKNHVHHINSEKWCAPDFIKVYVLLCRIDTYFSFWFINQVIGVWTTDLFGEISSTTKLIG